MCNGKHGKQVMYHCGQEHGTVRIHIHPHTVHVHTLTNNLSLLEKGDPSVVSVGGS